MAPKIPDPIMLYGFCWDTQKRQVFNQSWACAWHSSWYTDEHHPLWDSVDAPNLRREIRYGNNIYVLFRALLHCRSFYGQSALWAAISRGFNTSPTIARVTAEILTDARRAHRGRPARDVSDTARAADDWIDFLDSRESHPRMLSDAEVYKAADEFFKTQEKQHVNAARVPINGRPQLPSSTRQPPRGPTGDAGTSPRFPPSSWPIKRESPGGLSSTRKRSASPPAGDRAANAPATREAPNMPAQLAPQPSAPLKREEAPNTSNQAATDEIAALKARTARLEKELAEAKNKLSSAQANAIPSNGLPAKPTPTTAPPSQLREDMGGLKKDMASATNAIGTMMESMHDIVDSLNSLQDETSGLCTQQKDLTSNLAQQQPQTQTLDTILPHLQTLTTTVNRLLTEVSDLKKATHQQPPSPPPQQQQQQEAADRPLETLLHAQNTRIDKLFREIAGMRMGMTSSPGQPQPPQQQQQQQQPQTLRQAIAAAERDLKYHLGTVQELYHRGGASQAVTERTADLLAMLSEGLRAAQAGQGG
ncbi:hypothetical protein C8A00DRAFT_19283 [Chaetomidium leptoderma]|uniref:Uncharacterized protein n=1 Tax=Chaetomidium leptoderma TaxID=669021 RepID=A0AAN6ZU21_9PEZI|nr:hypothetical protein C8A00DRAFT_19283 [Chaetomidium leptoderma]